MRYIGCKENLLSFIEATIIGNQIDGTVFCDLFAGTASVSKHFKKLGYRIISNDMLYFSYVLQKAQIELNTTPLFATLLNSIKYKKLFFEIEKRNAGLGASSPAIRVINFLNSLNGTKGFFYNNYCLEGTTNARFKRNYFSSENAQKIDSIRSKISELKEDSLITPEEYFYLIACLMDAVSSVSNTSGTYGAFLKTTEPRSLKSLTLKPIDIIPSNQNNQVFCQDANTLAAEIRADITYLDPPYNTRQYAPYYHILETIARWDNPNVYGLTGRRPYNELLSKYSQKQEAYAALDELVSRINSRHILLSYNTEGILTQQQILDILAQKGKPEIFSKIYRRYKSNGSKIITPLKEMLYYVCVQSV